MDCLFCKIAAGEIPATPALETDEFLAFHDIDAQAPLHVLVIPRRHVVNLADEAADASLLGDLLETARAVARKLNLEERGYRVVLNVGGDGGQTVPHLHAHVLGGRALHWPPG